MYKYEIKFDLIKRGMTSVMAETTLKFMKEHNLSYEDFNECISENWDYELNGMLPKKETIDNWERILYWECFTR